MGIPTFQGQNLPHQHFPGTQLPHKGPHLPKWVAQFTEVKVKVKRWKLERESCKRERKRERWMGGVTVNCVGVEAKRSSTLDLSALGCTAQLAKNLRHGRLSHPSKHFTKYFQGKLYRAFNVNGNWDTLTCNARNFYVRIAERTFFKPAPPLRTWQRRFWIEVHGTWTRKWYPWSSVWKGVPQQQRASLFFFSGGEGEGGQCPVGNTGHYIKLYLEVRQNIFLSPSTKLYFRSVCFKCNVASLASRRSRQHIFTSLPKSYSQTNCETIFLQLPSPASILSGLY